MGLETGNTINDLNVSWPLGTDPKSQGDDHIRLIKSVLQNDALSLSEGGMVSGDLILEGALLDINSNGNAFVNMSVADVDKFRITYDGSDNPFMLTLDSTPLLLGTNGIERMRIDSDGDLLVGLTTKTDTPTYGGVYISADRSSGASNAYAQMFINHSSSDNHGLVIKELVSTGGNAVIFLNSSGTTIGSISTTSSATAYNESSDYRLKEDIRPMTDATTRLMLLNPVNFRWKVDGSRVDGFIAHEAQAVVPEAVTGEKDAVDSEGNPEYQGIDKSKLVPLLVATVQELVKRIEELEAK
jgi:hypothetical protein